MMRRYLFILAVVLTAVVVFTPALRAAESSGADKLRGLEDSYKSLYKKVCPAVVGITTLHKKKSGTPGRTRPRRSSLPIKFDSYGSGVVIEENGYILTTLDVVPAKTKKITVFFPDGKKAPGRLVGYSELNNIALIKVERSSLATVEFGDSSKVRPGSFSMTLGSPFFATLIDGATVFSVGVVSGVYRSHGMGKYRGMAIETDATVTNGSDGGALFDSSGKLIGVLDMSQTKSKWMGLAIPINQIKVIIEDLKKDKKVGPGFLGIRFEKGNTIPTIAEIRKDSPAEKAGMKVGDIIVRFCGAKIKDYKALIKILDQLPPETFFTAMVRRRYSQKIVHGTMTRNPGNIKPRTEVGPSVTDPTPTTGKGAFFGIKMGPSEGGVVIQVIQTGSPADKAGLKKGDLITSFDGKKVASPDALRKVLAACTPGQVCKVRIMRKVGDESWGKTVRVKLAKRDTFE